MMTRWPSAIPATRRTTAAEHASRDNRGLNNKLSVLGVCVAVSVVVENVVHHGRSPADLGHDHVTVDGLGYVG